MIEKLTVIRCDALVDLPARRPRSGMPVQDGAAKTVQCTRHFPVRAAMATVWQAAVKRGWSQCPDLNGEPRQLCPDHSAAESVRYAVAPA